MTGSHYIWTVLRVIIAEKADLLFHLMEAACGRRAVGGDDGLAMLMLMFI